MVQVALDAPPPNLEWWGCASFYWRGPIASPNIFVPAVHCKMQGKGRTASFPEWFWIPITRESFFASHMPAPLQLMDTCFEYRVPFGDTEKGFPPGKSRLLLDRCQLDIFVLFHYCELLCKALLIPGLYWAWEFAVSTCQKMSRVFKSPQSFSGFQTKEEFQGFQKWQ